MKKILILKKKSYMHKDYSRNLMEKNVLCWAYYCVLMITKKIDLITLQVMHCILCCNSLVLNLNIKTQDRKGVIHL
jgi:hypothetical protein